MGIVKRRVRQCLRCKQPFVSLHNQYCSDACRSVIKHKPHVPRAVVWTPAMIEAYLDQRSREEWKL